MITKWLKPFSLAFAGLLTGLLLVWWVTHYQNRIIEIVNPVLISIMIAYILQPMVNRLMKWGLSRTLSILIIYLLLISLIVGSLTYIIPLIVSEITRMIDTLPDQIKLFEEALYKIETSFREKNLVLNQEFQSSLQSNITKIQQELGEIFSRLLDFTLNLFSKAFLLIFAPMLTFYILKDVERLNRLLKNALPKTFYQEGHAVLLRIHLVLGNWLRGQLLICLLLTVMVYIGLKIIGLDYTLVVAIFCGITNIIPYFGPFIGVIPALIIAIPLGMPMLFKVILVYVIIQQIDGNILSPQIIGDRIGLNPLVIIIALLIGGEVGGFLGLVFAVPVAGIIKAIIEYYAGRKIRIQS